MFNFTQSKACMLNPIRNISLADYYFGLLSNLDAEGKLDLISKLSESLKKSEKHQNISLRSLFGALKTDESAEEMIAELRASRSFTLFFIPIDIHSIRVLECKIP